MADEDALLDVQLAEEMFQIGGHRFIGQLRDVRAVTVVTGIYSQHLTGQRTGKTLGMGEKEATERIFSALTSPTKEVLWQTYSS